MYNLDISTGIYDHCFLDIKARMQVFFYIKTKDAGFFLTLRREMQRSMLRAPMYCKEQSAQLPFFYLCISEKAIRRLSHLNWKYMYAVIYPLAMT